MTGQRKVSSGQISGSGRSFAAVLIWVKFGMNLALEDRLDLVRELELRLEREDFEVMSDWQ